MNAPVLDCSISLAWVLKDERSDAADSVFDLVVETGVVAPWLWWIEIRNALVVSERRGRTTADDTAEALTALDRLGIRLDDTPEGTDVLRLARRHGISAYDALYLELALREQRPLATLDRRLARAARVSGVDVLPATA